MRFICQTGCTKCCRLRGSVYLTEADLHRAAAYLGLTPAEFEARHVVRYRHVLRLRKLPRGQDHCRFVTAEGCSIHPAKPAQCRAYPFWPSLVESRTRWGLEGQFCPGIHQGPLVQINTAREIANELSRLSNAAVLLRRVPTLFSTSGNIPRIQFKDNVGKRSQTLQLFH